jgi:arylsulfatase A-like enzyme
MKRPRQSRHTIPHCIRLFLILLLAFAPYARADQLKRTSSGGRTSGGGPNIIMFLIDDQKPSSIAAFGGDTYTPNLDRMAEEGMRFTRAYVSSSVCTPSRYSFLTGRFAGNSHSKLYAEAVGGKENQGLPNFNVALERDKMNVGNVLREAGYTTGFVGKFHLSSSLDFPEFYQGKDGRIAKSDSRCNVEVNLSVTRRNRVSLD